MPTSKAPWTIDRGQIRDADGNSLASVPYALGDDQDRANQRLMCAAPALRDMLSLLVRTCNDSLRHDTPAQREALEETVKRAAALLRGLR